MIWERERHPVAGAAPEIVEAAAAATTNRDINRPSRELNILGRALKSSGALRRRCGANLSRNPDLKYVGRAIGLVPLGTGHGDTYRELLMQRVEREWRAARLLLWGYHGDERRQYKPIPYPYSLERRLDWVAGQSREDGGNARFPELKYFCDVSAYHGHNPSDSWTELLIAKADLDRLRNMVAAEHASQGLPSRNAVPTTLPGTPRVAIGDAVALVASRRNENYAEFADRAAKIRFEELVLGALREAHPELFDGGAA